MSEQWDKTFSDDTNFSDYILIIADERQCWLLQSIIITAAFTMWDSNFCTRRKNMWVISDSSLKRPVICPERQAMLNIREKKWEQIRKHYIYGVPSVLNVEWNSVNTNLERNTAEHSRTTKHTEKELRRWSEVWNSLHFERINSLDFRFEKGSYMTGHNTILKDRDLLVCMIQEVVPTYINNQVPDLK